MNTLQDMHREHVERRRRLYSAKPADVKLKPAPALPVEPKVTGPLMPELRAYDRAADRRFETLSSPAKIKNIIVVVAEHYGVSLIDVLSRRRSATIVRPRQVAMYLAKTMTLRSLPEIGRRFGGRDHTTVLHGVRKIEGLVAADAQFESEIEAIKRALLDT